MQVGSEPASMKPISVCQITYENSSTGTDLSHVSSPPSRTEPHPLTGGIPAAPGTCMPSHGPLNPPVCTDTTTNATACEAAHSHAARMQLRTLLRLRQRTLKRIQSLRNSIPEDCSVDFFGPDAVYIAPLPQLRSRTSVLPPLPPARAHSGRVQQNPSFSQAGPIISAACGSAVASQEQHVATAAVTSCTPTLSGPGDVQADGNAPVSHAVQLPTCLLYTSDAADVLLV